MAKTGLRIGKINQIDTSTNKYKTLTDNKVPEFPALINISLTKNNSSAELYANDVLNESDYSFTDGELSIEVAEISDKQAAEYYGNNMSTNEGSQSVDDIAPEFGYGYVIPKMINGAKKFKVEFFPRIKFTAANTSEAKTKANGVEFTTTTLTAKVYPLNKAINGMNVGLWNKYETFDTFDAAETYLDGLLTPAA